MTDIDQIIYQIIFYRNKRCLQWFLKFILHLGRPVYQKKMLKAAAEALSAESLATKDDIRKLDKELSGWLG